MNYAPLHNVAVLATTGRREVTYQVTPIQPAYNLWAEHYNTCPTCNREDWMRPETSHLCPTGQRLMRQWTDAAMRPCTITGKPPERAGKKERRHRLEPMLVGKAAE